MTTPTEDVLNRYRARETVIDSRGRSFTVRRLKPSETFRLRKLAETDDFGLLAGLSAAASVCGTDSAPNIGFPKNIGECYSMLDLLDIEGITAIRPAMEKLNGDGQVSSDTETGDDGEPGA